MKKKILFPALFIFSVFLWAAPLNIGILNGPSAVPAAYVIENHSEYNFQIFSGADTELPKLIKGDLDIGVLPPNAAAKAFSMSKGKIAALAVTGGINLSLVTTDRSFKKLSDLKGKTVYCAGRGATPDYIFRELLSRNKLEDSVTLDFSIPNAELAASLISGKTEYILVPEPFASTAVMKGKEKGVRKVYDLSKDFPENLPMTLLVCNADSYEKNKNEIGKFLECFETAVLWTNKNPDLAGSLVEKHTLGLNAAITKAAVPFSRYLFVSSKDAKKETEELLKLFLKANPESIGGKLPSDEFYK